MFVRCKEYMRPEKVVSDYVELIDDDAQRTTFDSENQKCFP